MKQYRYANLRLGVMALATFMLVCLTVPAQAAVTVGEPAPEFEAIGSDNQLHKLSDYRGKTVVLEWTNFQCPFVRKFYDAGNMQKWQQQYTGEDVVWLTIVSSAKDKQGHLTVEEAAETLSNEQANPTVLLLDETGVIGKMYGAKTTPHMYVIDADGILRYAGAIDSIPSTKMGDIDKADNYVALALAALKEGGEIEVTSTTPYGCSVKYDN